MRSVTPTFYFWLGLELLTMLALCSSGDRMSTLSCTLKSPPPSTSICGQRGNVFNVPKHQHSSNSTVSTEADCLSLCSHRAYTEVASQSDYEDCRFLGFDKKSRTCVIWQRDSKFQSDSSSLYMLRLADTYSEISCYDCPVRCPTTTDENLIDNGGFEFSNTLYGPWKPYRGGIPRIVSPGLNSAHALKFNIDIYQDRNLCNNQTYFVTFDAKFGDPLGQSRTLSVGDYTLDISSKPNSNYTEWINMGGTFQYNYPFNEVEESSVRLLFIGETMIVDNVAIKAVSSEYLTTGDSLLENGGFESGELEPWSHSNYYNYSGPHGITTIVQPGLTSSSNYAFRHVQNFKYYPATHYSGAAIYITQNYTTTLGTYYQISFNYRTERANSMTIDAGRNQWKFSKQHGAFPNRVSTFSRIFMGSGEAELFSILVEGGYSGRETRKSRTFLDNIEIKALASQIIG